MREGEKRDIKGERGREMQRKRYIRIVRQNTSLVDNLVIVKDPKGRVCVWK